MIEINLVISQSVRNKLRDKHNVTEDEIKECFLNKDESRGHLEDTRADHRTDPVTMWFISETHKERRLKVVWMNTEEGVVIKSAFPPNEIEERIYTKHA